MTIPITIQLGASCYDIGCWSGQLWKMLRDRPSRAKSFKGTNRKLLSLFMSNHVGSHIHD